MKCKKKVVTPRVKQKEEESVSCYPRGQMPLRLTKVTPFSVGVERYHDLDAIGPTFRVDKSLQNDFECF